MPDWSSSKLSARLQPDAARACPIGDWSMLHDAERDSVVSVPTSIRPGVPAPLLVCLHGLGGHARHRIDPLKPFSERYGIVLVSPASQAATWDVVLGDFGADVQRLDTVLAATFASCAIDPNRIGIEGFSDGASYALTLGLANGDLFTHIFAFSPRRMVAHQPVARPRVFIAHGTEDPEIPISCSRDEIVPELRELGYDVEYHEFAGRHEIKNRFLVRMFEIFMSPVTPAVRR